MIVTTSERLIFTLFLSFAVHFLFLYCISFEVTSRPSNQTVTNIEITLVKQKTDVVPEKPDYLAQVTNEGGGETNFKDPLPAELSNQDTVINQRSSHNVTAEPATKPEITTPLATVTPPTTMAKTEQELKPKTKAPQLITQKKAEPKVIKPTELAEKTVTQTTDTPVKPKINAQQLIMNAKNEIARLEQQLDSQASSVSKQPKKRRISAATKQYSAASYMRSWEDKVERIGNFNYPEEAKRLGLKGSLMLSVDINPDGSVPLDGIVVSRSSGYKVLDDAAIRIVRLGAPYAAIPKDVLGESEMLTIIRTWKFDGGQSSTNW